MQKSLCPVALVVATLALIAVGALALFSIQQGPSNSAKTQPPTSSGSASTLGQQKLRLEVIQLKHETGLWGDLQPFAPVAAAVVALLALAGTTVQYLRDRKRERELRVEEGIADSTNALTAFPGDPDTGIGTVVAALRNLRGFVDKAVDPTTLQNEVTEILTSVAREDLDYRDARHARFDSLCFQYWEAYQNYQVENPKENLYVLDQYIEALDDLEKRTGLVKSAIFGPAGIRNVPGATNSQINHLTRLVTGYGLRIKLLPDNEEQAAQRRFFNITGKNKSLLDRMLSSSLEMGAVHVNVR